MLARLALLLLRRHCRAVLESAVQRLELLLMLGVCRLQVVLVLHVQRLALRQVLVLGCMGPLLRLGKLLLQARAVVPELLGLGEAEIQLFALGLVRRQRLLQLRRLVLTKFVQLFLLLRLLPELGRVHRGPKGGGPTPRRAASVPR